MKLHLPTVLRKVLLASFICMASSAAAANMDYVVSGGEGVSDNLGSKGGAIYKRNGTVSLSGYGSLRLINNDVTQMGGAICATLNTGKVEHVNGYTINIVVPNSVTLSGIGNINISRNDATRYGEDVYGSKKDGVGGAIYGNTSISNCGDVLFKSNTACGSAGAVYGSLSVTGADVLTFNGNRAGGYGGAVYGSVTINRVGEVRFENNRADSLGGAILGGTRISDCGMVLFEGNTSDKSCGAIGGLTEEVLLSGNDSVIFRDNKAGNSGGAIAGSIIRIQDNNEIIIDGNTQNGSYAALDASKTLYITGNEQVVLRDNGTSIDAQTLYLSTSDNELSRVEIYDGWRAQTATFNQQAKGAIVLSGKGSRGEISGSASLQGGLMKWENGAKLSISGSLTLSGSAALAFSQDSCTMLEVNGSLVFNDASKVSFVLDTPVSSATAMVEAGTIAFSSSCVEVDTSAFGQDGFAGSQALLSVNNGFTYAGKTFTYSSGGWSYNGNAVNNINAILPFTNMSSSDLTWIDNTLYYTIADTGAWEYSVKGLGEDLTWRGDVLDIYDNVKDRKSNRHNESYIYTAESDTKLCWVAAASNLIAYWQDKYAELYQGEALVTPLQSEYNDSEAIYDYMQRYVYNVSHSPAEALTWWFADYSVRKCSLLDSLIGIPIMHEVKDGTPFAKKIQYTNWIDLGFTSDNIKSVRVPTDDTSLKATFEAWSHTDAPFIIGYNWFDKNGKQVGAHAVTCWRVKSDGAEITFEYTDSDDAVYTQGIGETRLMKGRIIDNKLVITNYTDSQGLKEAVSDEFGNFNYYIFSGGDVYAEITILYYLETPLGVEEMLESYQTNHVLHWTGLQKDSQWATSSTMEDIKVRDKETNKIISVPVSHLARPEDGWKKECKGGVDTIYAHAYITRENESESSFVFADSVNGVNVTNKTVELVAPLDVSNVLVSGSGYRFIGQGALSADAMTVSGNLTLADKVVIRDTPLAVSGVVSVDLDKFDKVSPALDGCTISMDGGVIWCAGMALEASETGTILVGNKSYIAEAVNLQMQYCKVMTGGVFGCTLDFGLLKNLTINITDIYAASCKNVLDEQVYGYLTGMNTLTGAQTDYAFIYQIRNADIVANAADIETYCPVISGSSLTITSSGNSPSLLTIGSSGSENGSSRADITVSEDEGATVVSEKSTLMTLSGETPLFSSETSITAPVLLVGEDSKLRNEGNLIGVEKINVEYDALLSGSGQFGKTVVYDSGRLMVGSSPGAPRYESLTMLSGSELIFCLDGSTPASADKQGWGSGTHSVLTVTQAGGLLVENGTTVSVGCSLDFLNQSPLGERQTLSLVQLEAAGDAALLTALQSGTQFMLAEEDDSLSPLTEVGAHVHHAQWEQGADNTLQLSFIVSSCPEDALIWTNAGGDGIWNEISQNWETLSGTASLFAAGRNVAFYQGGTVVLNDKVTVGDVVVSTAENLRWEGNGGIAGSGTLVKEGPGTLTVATDNSDFDGRVEIYGGRLTATATTSLGSGIVVLDGGTLEIGADGIGNAIMNASDGTVEVASGITHQLKETIYNVGTLKLIGRFDAGELEAVASEQNKRVDVNGLVRKDGEGSGFLRTGDAEVTVAGNLGDPHTVDSSAAVMLYKGQTLEMNNGVGVVAGTVDYSQYLLTGNDRAAVSKIEEQAGAQLRSIEMNGGHLSVNTDCDVLKATAGEVLLQGSRLGGSIGGSTSVSVSGESELSGDNCYSGGTILRDGAALTIGHDNALGCGIVTNEGIGSIDVREGKRLTLHRAIANSGTLSLCGALDAGKLNLDIEVVGYVDMDGKATTGSGFVKAASYAVQLVEGGKTVNAGARVTHDGYRMRSELQLGEDGVARAGGGVDYSRFYLTGEDAVSVRAVDAVSEAKGSDLLDVWMDGGELEVDADITVDALGGSIVITDDSVLRGAIADTDITAGAGDYTSDITAKISGGSKVTVNGGAVTLSGANSYTGGTIVNAGTLVAGSDMAFGTGEVELRGGVMELNQRPLENKLLAQGGIISGGSGFRGAVVFNGSVGLRGNLSARSMTINSGSVLTLNGSTISVSGSLTLGGSAVLNLNGSDFGAGDVLITFGSLRGSEEQLTVDYGTDSDKYSVEKKGNALILSWLEETQPEEEEKPEPLPPVGPEIPEQPVPTLDRDGCDALVQSSWGVFTASHAFADAIGGQRSAAGYVGRPESVAWMSALGGMHRIDGTGSCSGSDIDLFGAAVGLEHYMSATDAVGIAVGRLSGDVKLKNSGRETEQEGTYIGVYGTHQLAEFARTDSLNLRWNAVYGDTETEGSIGQEEMSRTQDSVQLNARLSWTSLLSDAWVLNLFAGMEYFASESAENEESEEARVRMGSIQNLRGELGIGTRYMSGSTSLYGEVRYLNDMVRSNPYAEINGLRGYGANPGRQGIGVTLGAQQELGNGWSVHASYSLEAMSEATMHSANVGVGLRF